MERARIIHSDEKVPLALRSEVLRSDHKFMIDKRALAGVLVMLGLTAPVACSTTDGDGAGGGGSSSGGSSGDPAADGGAPPQACEKPADCPSKVCTNKVCAAPSPTDGVMNADETDVDCGGGGAPKCDTDRKCKAPGDCASGVCLDKGSGLVCQAPSPTDGAKNGDETDVDCGGAKAPKCADGKGCKLRGDCASDVCDQGVCKAPAIDGVQNGTETDIDCGGPTAPRCADGLKCQGDGDCTSDVCTGLICQAPSPTDGKKNGTETDVDCGGAGNPTCATGKTCLVHADCTSDGCAYNGKCADKRSCTAMNGGDTCGFGGAGGRGAAQWESCCATAPAGNGGVQMNKYQVTSGRMRAFLTRVNGNVRAFVQSARAAGKIPTTIASSGVTGGIPLLRSEWDAYLPTSMEGDGANDYTSAYRHVGGTIFMPGQDLGQQGCDVQSPGTHTYWMPANIQSAYFGDVPHAHSQAVYDTKALQCVPYLMAQAFCIWDGGRLETFAEWLAAIGPTTYPWGASPAMNGPGSTNFFDATYPKATDASLGLPATQSRERGVFNYSYEYPNLVEAPMGQPYWADYVSFISAPGRTMEKGKGPWGHADLAGNMMEVTSDITTNNADPRSARMRWTSNGSWEGHGYSKSVQWNGFTLVNKYGKQGLRCVYP